MPTYKRIAYPDPSFSISVFWFSRSCKQSIAEAPAVRGLSARPRRVISTIRRNQVHTWAVWPHEWRVCGKRNSHPSLVAQRPVLGRCVRGRWFPQNELARIYQHRAGSSQHGFLDTPRKRSPRSRPPPLRGGGQFGLRRARNSSPLDPKSSAELEE